MSNKTVLIIDDHTDFREMLRSFIGKRFSDINILEAATGEEGIKMALKVQPNISLIDVRLPGIDGLEAGTRIKAQIPQCQVIIMSMFKDVFQKSMGSKPSIFINKSDIDGELLPLLCKYLNGKKS